MQARTRIAAALVVACGTVTCGGEVPVYDGPAFARDPAPIGALNLTIDESGSGIYGFGVLPEYRGRGYGRQILARAIEYAQAVERPPIFLEVAPENDAALGLYTSVGFRETHRYDYFILAI